MKRGAIYILIAIVVAVLGGCTDNNPRPEELAMNAAKVYYDQLAHGDYASFVAGTDGYDSIPDGFREQLEVNMKQFMAEIYSDHKGIASIEMVDATADTLMATADAYVSVRLRLCFADSTKEQIVVPMIERDGIWKMK